MRRRHGCTAAVTVCRGVKEHYRDSKAPVAQASSRWYPLLLMFGEGLGPGSGVAAEGDGQLALAEGLGPLQELLVFADAVQAVVLNLAAQLGSLSAAQMRKATIVQGEAHRWFLHAAVGVTKVAQLCWALNQTRSTERPLRCLVLNSRSTPALLEATI